MPRTKKPSDPDAEEVEPTLSDIAKALTLLTATVNSVQTTLNEQIVSHKKEVETNAQNHKDLKQELADIKDELNTVTNKAEEIDTVNKEQAAKIKVLEEKVQDYENEKRSHNVIIEGLPESNNEDIRATIDGLFNDLGLDFSVEWCDSVYRMGVRAEGNKRGRPVKIVFP